MQIYRQEVVDLLQERGDMVTADQAQSKLPEQFESDEYGDQLGELGVDPQDLASVRDGGSDTADGAALGTDGVIRPVSPI